MRGGSTLLVGVESAEAIAMACDKEKRRRRRVKLGATYVLALSSNKCACDALQAFDSAAMAVILIRFRTAAGRKWRHITYAPVAQSRYQHSHIPSK